MHKSRHFGELSISELVSYRRLLKKKIQYWWNLYDEMVEVEENNQDDYGMLATAQSEMDFAEAKVVKCEQKLKTVDQILLAKCIAIWLKRK